MASLSRIILTPYFGEFPKWMDKFKLPNGYDWLLDTNLELFKKRVKRKLEIDWPIDANGSKLGDYRSLLGYLYEDEIKGYDYWGHCDFDMVFGDVNKFFPDEELKELDVWSNHDTYICGCWTLYRNCDEVNKLFQSIDYGGYLIHPEINGWIENEFSRLLEKSGLRYKYSFEQGDPYHPPFNIAKFDDTLYQYIDNDWQEIAMLHFRRDKNFPL